MGRQCSVAPAARHNPFLGATGHPGVVVVSLPAYCHCQTEIFTAPSARSEEEPDLDLDGGGRGGT